MNFLKKIAFILILSNSLLQGSLLAGNSITLFKSDLQRSGFTNAWIPTRNLHEKWQVKLAEPGDELYGESLGSSQVIVANDVVYVRWIDRVYAFHRQDGSAYWPAHYQNPALAGGDIGLTYADGILFLPGSGGKMIALNAMDKSVKWQYSSPGGGKSWSAIAEGDQIYFVGGRSLNCLDKSTGQEKWTFSNGQTGVLAHVAKQGNMLVYTTASGYNEANPVATNLVAVDARNGTLIWEKSALDIRMTIALTENYVITGTLEQSHAFNLSDGAAAWSSFGSRKIEPNQGGGGIAVSATDQIYIALSDGVKEERGGAYGFSANDEIWWATFSREYMTKYGNRSDPWACAPVIGKTADQKLVGGVDKYGTMIFNNLATGNTVLEYHFYRSDQTGISRYGYKTYCSPALIDGEIFVALGDGKVYCIAGDVEKSPPSGSPIWQEQSIPQGIETLFDVSFSDAQNGLASAKGRILRTSNGGNSWVEVKTSGMKDWIYGLTHKPNGGAVAVGQYGVFLNSANGNAWNVGSTNAQKHAGRGVFFIDEQNGWFAGHNGYIFKSSDGGSGWQRIQGTGDDNDPVFSMDYEDVVFNKNQIGLAVGMRGLISRSADGGNTWETVDPDWAVNETNDDFFAVDFADQNTAIAVGALGLIRKSTDAGKSWQTVAAPVSFTFYDIKFIDAKQAYIAGTFGSILYSNDAGETWQVQPTGTVNPFFRLDFVDANHGWAVGSAGAEGFVMRTQQAGQTAVGEAIIPGESAYNLSKAYPNPFSIGSHQNARRMHVEFEIPRPERVKISVYNILGQKVKTLVDAQIATGKFQTSWDGLDMNNQRVSPGIYFFQMIAGQNIRLQSALILK